MYSCVGFYTGQYSFPFSFKTFEGWPSSFSYNTTRKKGVIEYHITVAIEPSSLFFNVRFKREITLRETRVVQAQTREDIAKITHCCCMSKGVSKGNFHFAKDGYMPGEVVQLVLEIDNSACEVGVEKIHVSVTNEVSMKSEGNSTSDRITIF